MPGAAAEELTDMSLVHRLIVGHFDIDTFVPRRPVPLRSLDVPGTRAMLEEIGVSAGEGEYVVDGEPLYFAGGYCDCPWLSNKHNEKSERFARAVAEAEDCYLVETGAGTIRHPVRSVQAAPSGTPQRDGRRSAPLPHAEAEARARDDDPGVICRTVLEVADCEGDWVEGFCAGLAGYGHFHARGNALFALGRLASRKAPLNRRLVQPIIERAMADPNSYVSGQATIAAEAVEHSLRWVIDAFDNGKPELDVTTYSNGWIRCPNCGWRYATYDPRAFREGRCMECRQELRVINAIT
jgi:hypothetical protein